MSSNVINIMYFEKNDLKSMYELVDRLIKWSDENEFGLYNDIHIRPDGSVYTVEWIQIPRDLEEESSSINEDDPTGWVRNNFGI